MRGSLPCIYISFKNAIYGLLKKLSLPKLDAPGDFFSFFRGEIYFTTKVRSTLRGDLFGGAGGNLFHHQRTKTLRGYFSSFLGFRNGGNQFNHQGTINTKRLFFIRGEALANIHFWYDFNIVVAKASPLQGNVKIKLPKSYVK